MSPCVGEDPLPRGSSVSDEDAMAVGVMHDLKEFRARDGLFRDNHGRVQKMDPWTNDLRTRSMVNGIDPANGWEKPYVGPSNLSDDGWTAARASSRDRNPRYADQYALTIFEAAQSFDHFDANQDALVVRGPGGGSRVQPLYRWAQPEPLQFAYSPTFAAFVATDAMGTTFQPLEHHPSPAGHADATGWAGLFNSQLLTPWVYVVPTPYTVTDNAWCLLRMDTLTNTTADASQVGFNNTSTTDFDTPLPDPPLDQYKSGAIAPITFALSTDGNGMGPMRHDLSYSRNARTTESVPNLWEGAWSCGRSLVHYVRASVATSPPADFCRESTLSQEAPQTAVRWMELCGLSPSETQRNRKRYDLVLRPPIEAFGMWGNVSYVARRHWNLTGVAPTDGVLTKYKLDRTFVVKLLKSVRADAPWLLRRFPFADVDSPELLDLADPGDGGLRSPDWNVLYMRLRGYQSTLSRTKDLYFHSILDMLSSSLMLTRVGYERIDRTCLGDIFSGRSKYEIYSLPPRKVSMPGMPYCVPDAGGSKFALVSIYDHPDLKYTDPSERSERYVLGTTATPSIEHVIPRSTIIGSVRSIPETTIDRANHATESRKRMAEYVCGDPFNWLLSSSNHNLRRGAWPLGVALDGFTMDLRKNGLDMTPKATEDLTEAYGTDVYGSADGPRPRGSVDVVFPVDGANDHLFPLPPGAWLRVATAQIYMYLTYPGLPVLVGETFADGAAALGIRPFDDPAYPPSNDASNDASPSYGGPQYARFGVPGQNDVIDGRSGESGGDTWFEETFETHKACQLQWRQHLRTTYGLTTRDEHSGPNPREIAELLKETHHLDARTFRTRMGVRKRQTLFKTLLDAAGTLEFNESETLQSELVQRATGYVLNEYERMCERLDDTRQAPIPEARAPSPTKESGRPVYDVEGFHDSNVKELDGSNASPGLPAEKPLTSSDSPFYSWEGNPDGAYGRTVSTRYPRGWRNPLVQWSSRRRHAFLAQPTILRFLGRAMYGLSSAQVDEMCGTEPGDEDITPLPHPSEVGYEGRPGEYEGLLGYEVRLERSRTRLAEMLAEREDMYAKMRQVSMVLPTPPPTPPSNPRPRNTDSPSAAYFSTHREDRSTPTPPARDFSSLRADTPSPPYRPRSTTPGGTTERDQQGFDSPVVFNKSRGRSDRTWGR